MSLKGEFFSTEPVSTIHSSSQSIQWLWDYRADGCATLYCSQWLIPISGDQLNESLFTVDVCGPSLHSTQLLSPCMVVLWVVFLLGYASYRPVAVPMHINVYRQFWDSGKGLMCSTCHFMAGAPALAIYPRCHGNISHNRENKVHSRQASSMGEVHTLCFTISQRVCTPCSSFSV